jgi:hypothetical protein
LSPPGFAEFELNLIDAVLTQLVPLLDNTPGAPLTIDNARRLPEAQGIYVLLHDGEPRYIGKTDADAGLRSRLVRHARKFEQRRNIKPGDVLYKAVQVFVLTALDVESRLIAHYDTKWNGSSFGSNDPGRNRETTNKPASGFDAQFPIDIDIAGEFLPAGKQTVWNALVTLKRALPYTLRFQTVGGRNRPHPDYESAEVDVPVGPLAVRKLIELIVQTLPTGWQATEFVSHIILYKENAAYLHGKAI